MLTRSRFAAIILLLTFAVLPAAAQEFGPGILPSDTSFYIFSRGVAKAEAAYPGNPMVQSWNSPEFADLRQQGIAYLIRHSDWKANGRPVKFTPAETDQIYSFLKSPMMLGFSGGLDVGSLAQASAPSTKQLMDAGGMFVILDVTGKTGAFNLLFRLITANIPKDVTHTHVDFSGVGIEKFAGPNNTSFAAIVGNYFVWSNQQKVIQELVGRLIFKDPPRDSLAQNPSYQKCHAAADPDSISEVFFRVPDFAKTDIPPSDKFNTPAALRSLHLDSLRAMCGSYSINQQGEHSRGVILGDTTAGGIFDFFGSNRSHFDTLAFAPPNAYSYLSYSFDLPAIYKTVRAAAMAGLPQQQSSMIQIVEGMAGMQLGMSVPDILGLVGGEVANIQLDPNTTPPTQMYAITITNPEKVVTMFHKLGASTFDEDSHENGVTFFKSKISTPAPGTDVPAPPSYFAITPHFMLYGTDKPALRKATQLDSATGPTKGSSILDDPEISSLRAKLPHDLLGLMITDYSRHNWTADMSKSFDDMEKSEKAKLSPEDIQFYESLKKFSATKTGSIMLRRTAAGWWKDSDGIHYEGYSQ